MAASHEDGDVSTLRLEVQQLRDLLNGTKKRKRVSEALYQDDIVANETIASWVKKFQLHQRKFYVLDMNSGSGKVLCDFFTSGCSSLDDVHTQRFEKWGLNNYTKICATWKHRTLTNFRRWIDEYCSSSSDSHVYLRDAVTKSDCEKELERLYNTSRYLDIFDFAKKGIDWVKSSPRLHTWAKGKPGTYCEDARR